MSTTIDESRLEELTGQMVGHMTGAMVCFGAWLADELGLYRAMTGAGPLRADELAAATGCHPRLVREWLDGQAAAGLIAYDPAGDTPRPARTACGRCWPRPASPASAGRRRPRST